MIGWIFGGAREVWTTVGPYDAGYGTRYTVWVRRRVCVHVGIVGRMEGGGYDLDLFRLLLGVKHGDFSSSIGSFVDRRLAACML